MQVMVSNINPFTIQQSIYIVNDDGTAEELPSVDLEDLGSAIASAAHNCKITRVHLFGMEDFVKPIAQKIVEQHNYFFAFTGPIVVEIN